MSSGTQVSHSELMTQRDQMQRDLDRMTQRIEQMTANDSNNASQTADRRTSVQAQSLRRERDTSSLYAPSPHPEEAPKPRRRVSRPPRPDSLPEISRSKPRNSSSYLSANDISRDRDGRRSVAAAQYGAAPQQGQRRGRHAEKEQRKQAEKEARLRQQMEDNKPTAAQMRWSQVAAIGQCRLGTTSRSHTGWRGAGTAPQGAPELPGGGRKYHGQRPRAVEGESPCCLRAQISAEGGAGSLQLAWA